MNFVISSKQKMTELQARFGQMNRKQKVLALVGAAVVTTVVLAEATGTPAGTPPAWLASMNSVYQLLVDALAGPLGKILSITCLIAGAAVGAMKREFTWLLIGGFMALALGYGPAFINDLFSIAL